MLGNWLVVAALSAIGWCIWVRRYTWLLPWHRALSLSVVLQGIGFALCMPIQSHYLGNALSAVTGISHLRDYFGHLFYLAGTAAVVYAVSLRLFPDDQLRRFMRRVEVPGCLVAFVMLICVAHSPALHQPGADDFFDVPCDRWLVLYWTLYCAFKGYLIIYACCLLLVLRTSPASQRTADLFLASNLVCLVGVTARVADVLPTELTIPGYMYWADLVICAVIGSYAGASSWQARQTAT